MHRHAQRLQPYPGERLIRQVTRTLTAADDSISGILLAVSPVASPVGSSSPSPFRGPMLSGLILAIALLRPVLSSAQTAPSPSPQTSTDQEGDSSDKRIWGIIPNYRTSPTLQNYQPLTAHDKWKLTADDAFDRGTFMLAAAFAAKGQYYQDTPAFGHGFSAYGRYFAASTADYVVGDVMTEGVFPVLLRQDPRYFRRGTGSGASRLASAVGQLFWTHTDTGGSQFNSSEVIGNATAVAISNVYYPDNRNLPSDVSKLGVQLAVDLVANIIKEFSPDLDQFVTRHRRRKEP